MAQIWLTYEELGNLMQVGAAEARNCAAAMQWDRRRSRDGLTRVKLPPIAVDRYLEHLIAERFATGPGLARLSAPAN